MGSWRISGKGRNPWWLSMVKKNTAAKKAAKPVSKVPKAAKPAALPTPPPQPHKDAAEAMRLAVRKLVRRDTWVTDSNPDEGGSVGRIIMGIDWLHGPDTEQLLALVMLLRRI